MDTITRGEAKMTERLQPIHLRMAHDNATIEIADWEKLPSEPLVSVSMLAYRHEKFIAQAIDGVIAQQCNFPIELVIGEDCSPDNTREIVLDYQRRYPHLIRVLFSHQNVGMHANSARCSEALRGKYVAPCEGDDYWCDPLKISRQVAIFQRHPDCVLVFHAAKTIDEKTGREGLTGRRSPYSRFIRAEEVILGDGGFIPTASIMARRAPGLSSDWVVNAAVPDYAAQLQSARLGRIAYIDRVMSVYRTNVPNSWSSRHSSDLAYRIDHAQKIERMFDDFLGVDGVRYSREAAYMVSKYYSDALVRIYADRSKRNEFYQQISDKVIGSDHLLAWMAAKWGLQLPWAKTFIRKLDSFARLTYSLITTERIRDSQLGDFRT